MRCMMESGVSDKLRVNRLMDETWEPNNVITSKVVASDLISAQSVTCVTLGRLARGKTHDVVGLHKKPAAASKAECYANFP